MKFSAIILLVLIVFAGVAGAEEFPPPPGPPDPAATLCYAGADSIPAAVGTAFSVFPDTSCTADVQTFSISYNPSANPPETGTLPPGLTISSSTGEISGTPIMWGVFPVPIKATCVGNCGGVKTICWVTIQIPQADPYVAGVTGTASEDSTITISGRAFGVKDPAGSLLWDDLSQYDLDDMDPIDWTDAPAPWTPDDLLAGTIDVGNVDPSYPRYMDDPDSTRDGDPVYWGDRLTAVSIQGNIDQFDSDIGWGDPFVVDFWVQIKGKYNPEYYTPPPKNEGPFDYRLPGRLEAANRSVKLKRMWNREIPNPVDSLYQYKSGFSTHPIMLESLGSNGMLTHPSFNDRVAVCREGEWHHYTSIYHNAPSAATFTANPLTSKAAASGFIDGRNFADNVVAAPGYSQPQTLRAKTTPVNWLRRIGHDPNPNYFVAKTVKFHDISVDNTLARVVVSGDDDYDGTAESHLELQQCATWGLDEITFTLNTGSFSAAAGDTVYVYVTDETGAISNASGPLVLE